MTVDELINRLKKFPGHAVVMFNPVNSFKNEGIEGYNGVKFCIDDVGIYRSNWSKNIAFVELREFDMAMKAGEQE